jgi:ketosteroid isomerase-like protein
MNSESIRSWLEGYRLAWEQRDPEAVIKLFAEDAIYQETPFTQPMCGHEAIRQYWSRAVVAYQEQIWFACEILALTEVSAIAHWWASFVRVSNKVRVSLDGIFLLAFDDAGRCKELREWWVRKDQ